MNEKEEKIHNALKKWVEEERYCEALKTMTDVSRDLDIAPWDLKQYCQAYLKRNFNQWRRELRIKKAKELIREDPLRTFTSVRYAVGIEDKSDFNRSFFRVTGEYARDYKNRILKQRGLARK